MMLDSEDLAYALSHHLTWIHNYPKCDSCLAMNSRGRKTHQNGLLSIAPFPPLAAHHRGHNHIDGSSRDGLENQLFKPAVLGDGGGRFLPEISEGSWTHGTRPGYSVGRASALKQYPTIQQSTYLPDIVYRPSKFSQGSPRDGGSFGVSNRGLSKSLDSSTKNQGEGIQHDVHASLPSLVSTTVRNRLRGQGSTWSLSITTNSDSGVFEATVDDEQEESGLNVSRTSLDDHDSEGDDDEQGVTIDPFPYQSERTPYESDVEAATPKPPTPPVKKKKKKKKKKVVQPTPRRRRTKKAKRPYVRKPQINFAALRRQELELAKMAPVKKLFTYSTILENELQSYMPPRLPGGKLKPVYKRTETGDILLPADPISIEIAELKDDGDVAVKDSPWQLTRRKQEALHTFLDRKKKVQKHALSKVKTRRVRFILPPGHVDSGSEYDSSSDEKQNENDGNVDGESSSQLAAGEREARESDADDERSEEGAKQPPYHESNVATTNDVSTTGDAATTSNAPSIGDGAISDRHSPGLSVISEEAAAREHERHPTQQDSEQLTKDWPETNMTKGGTRRDGKRGTLTDSARITNYVVKPAKVSEAMKILVGK